ncbi:MAG TPA: DMT family transporter [Balneolales bacterium]|nr:DMT family transporter [Balneolales bacterium]
MGILFVLLSVGCSLLIAHLLKYCEQYNLRLFRVLTVNYAVASVVAYGMSTSSGPFPLYNIPLWLTGLIIITGFIFIFNFVIYSRSINTNGVGVSIAAMRISLLIPVSISILFFGELLTGWKTLGIFIVIISLFLLIFSRPTLSKITVNNHIYLLVLFFFTGIGDAALKIYQVSGSLYIDKSLFMSGIFIFAFLTGVILSIRKGGAFITKKELLMGLWIGIPNLFSSIFLIKALDYSSGSFVFSLVNVLIVIGGALIGKIYWRDYITKRQYAGMGLALLAIVLLWI